MPKTRLWEKRYGIHRHAPIRVLQASEDAALRQAGVFFYQRALEVEEKAYRREWGQAGQRVMEAYRRFFQVLTADEYEQIQTDGFSHELNQRLQQFIAETLEAQ